MKTNGKRILLILLRVVCSIIAFAWFANTAGRHLVTNIPVDMIFLFVGALSLCLAIIIDSRATSPHQSFQNYVENARGISPTGLNIMALIGVFIFGWLIVVVFQFLGKTRKGWKYAISITMLLAMARSTGYYLLYYIALFVYVTAWIHANITLGQFQELAKERIEEIENETYPTSAMIKEKEVLQRKVLRAKGA